MIVKTKNQKCVLLPPSLRSAMPHPALTAALLPVLCFAFCLILRHDSPLGCMTPQLVGVAVGLVGDWWWLGGGGVMGGVAGWRGMGEQERGDPRP